MITIAMKRTKSKIVEDYKEWLINDIYNREFSISYDKLFNKMFDTEFRYSPIDKNRAFDGVYLRYVYADAEGMDEKLAEKEFDIFPCSVLEALVALARRCEEDIMGDSNIYGDRTGQWFWEMLDNIGLTKYNDSNYDDREVSDILDHFMDREYGPHGEYCAF